MLKLVERYTWATASSCNLRLYAVIAIGAVNELAAVALAGASGAVTVKLLPA